MLKLADPELTAPNQHLPSTPLVHSAPPVLTTLRLNPQMLVLMVTGPSPLLKLTFTSWSLQLMPELTPHDTTHPILTASPGENVTPSGVAGGSLQHMETPSESCLASDGEIDELSYRDKSQTMSTLERDCHKRVDDVINRLRNPPLEAPASQPPPHFEPPVSPTSQPPPHFEPLVSPTPLHSAFVSQAFKFLRAYSATSVNRFLCISDKKSPQGGWAAPRGTAILGQPVEQAKQASVHVPNHKN